MIYIYIILKNTFANIYIFSSSELKISQISYELSNIPCPSHSNMFQLSANSRYSRNSHCENVCHASCGVPAIGLRLNNVGLVILVVTKQALCHQRSRFCWSSSTSIALSILVNSLRLWHLMQPLLSSVKSKKQTHRYTLRTAKHPALD